jgi:hypothetical protein
MSLFWFTFCFYFLLLKGGGERGFIYLFLIHFYFEEEGDRGLGFIFSFF